MNLGTTELLIILAIVLLLFGGGSKIPQIFGGFGKGIREFKKGMNGEDNSNKSTSEKKDA